MKILLDTHFVLWVLADKPPPAFSAKAISLIDAADEVYFSSASIWEIGLKWKRGKIARKPRQFFQSAVENRSEERRVGKECA